MTRTLLWDCDEALSFVKNMNEMMEHMMNDLKEKQAEIWSLQEQLEKAKKELEKYKPPEGRCCENCASLGTEDSDDDWFCYLVHAPTSKDNCCGWWEKQWRTR